MDLHREAMLLEPRRDELGVRKAVLEEQEIDEVPRVDGLVGDDRAEGHVAAHPRTGGWFRTAQKRPSFFTIAEKSVNDVGLTT